MSVLEEPLRVVRYRSDPFIVYTNWVEPGQWTLYHAHDKDLLAVIALQYIQPGKPQQNAYVERFNRTVRHEWLDQHLFESVQHAQETATQWLWRYNTERPNMAVGGITPYQKLAQAA